MGALLLFLAVLTGDSARVNSGIHCEFCIELESTCHFQNPAVCSWWPIRITNFQEYDVFLGGIEVRSEISMPGRSDGITVRQDLCEFQRYGNEKEFIRISVKRSFRGVR
jgi:hypothetical protein